MPEYEEESDFDFDSYYNKFIPFVQEWANEVSERLYGYGVNSIKVTKVRSIYSMTCIQQKPTNYITMFWINTDGRGVIRNISQKQNYARC